MKTYKSRIGLETLVFATILIAFLAFLSYSEKDKMFLLSTIAAVALFAHWVWATCYTINEKTLKVKSSFYYDETINIDTIKSITEITDIFSAPATSIKRLSIQFNDSESILISPKDKSGFIKSLTQVNPNIELKLNN